MEGDPAPVLRAEGLTKRYGGFTAVDGLDLEVRAGECFGLLGPNGAGKSSTLKMIYGRTSISGGRLQLFGREAGAGGDWFRGDVGVVGQEDSLDPDLTLQENLYVYARYYGRSPDEARKRADELLRFAQLEERAGSRVDALSGGMKRRLMVVRGLVNHPRLLILDEPTTGLDPRARRLVWEQLEQLKREGVTLLLTTHYMEEAERLCDRIAMMYGGRLLVEGAPGAVVEQVVGRSVLELPQAAADTAEEILRREDVRFVREERIGDSLLLYHAGPVEELRTLADALFRPDRGAPPPDADGLPARVSVRPSSLEDVFLILTGRGLTEQ